MTSLEPRKNIQRIISDDNRSARQHIYITVLQSLSNLPLTPDTVKVIPSKKEMTVDFHANFASSVVEPEC